MTAKQRQAGIATKSQLSVCVVAAAELLLDGLSRALSGAAGVSATWYFPTAEAALQGVDWHQVDVLLVELDLRGLSGVALIQKVRASGAQVQCLALSANEDQDSILDAIRAGSCGYLLHECSPEDIVQAIRQLHVGGAPMSPRVARKLVQALKALPGREGWRDQEQADAMLTPRELEVLARLEQGQSYKEIAGALGLSVHTVHGHLKRIYEKFQAHGSREAIVKARRLGVL